MLAQPLTQVHVLLIGRDREVVLELPFSSVFWSIFQIEASLIKISGAYKTAYETAYIRPGPFLFLLFPQFLKVSRTCLQKLWLQDAPVSLTIV
ncbi:hypothetical protein A3SI_06729 [Nitritalea halalkaliphila LW7]|uniref:Uncharacterized protein n=1 Tax=Nitritalea halalkaliphila LW7 TaxID=1189621 RepID=I5C609_9BACT|nr:hypothetical protein A3SI_06729 [Nitritalea halalkaliphila LW7]